MSRIAWLCLLVLACNKDSTPTGAPAEAPKPAPATAAPSRPLPEAKPYMSAGVLPKELTGQIMRNGQLVDVKLDGYAVMTGCDDIIGHGGDMILNEPDGKALVVVHMGSGVQVDQPVDLSKMDPVIVMTWIRGTGDPRMVRASGGTLLAHKLVGQIDLELDANFGADGKLHARMVTAAPVGECGKN